jgi:hypothetical protein
MMNFLDKSRRGFLKYIYGATLSILVPACNKKGDTGPAYGPPRPAYGVPGPPVPMYGVPPYGPTGPNPANDVAIRGSVFSDSTKAPIPGIKVSVKDMRSESYTDENGDFVIYVPIQDAYKLKFEDTDGGSFKPQKTRITLETLEDINAHLNIYLLDEIAEEDA